MQTRYQSFGLTRMAFRVLAVFAWAWCSALQAAPTVSVLAAPSGSPATSRALELAPQAYVEQEFFMNGAATVYEPVGVWESDGQWAVRPLPSAHRYATRLLVRRPADPAKFNGIVVVEWLNTTFGFDVDGEWIMSKDEFMREGYAWVGVTADQVGTEEGLKQINPARYADRSIAGADWAYSIFSQAGQAVRQHAHLLLAGASPKKLLAGGYSQSAVLLTTYANALQPLDRVYDGFLLHSRAPVAAPLNADQSFFVNPRIRADLDVPVLQVQSEGEVAISWPLSKTVDTDKVRYWEVAGAAHVDQYLVDQLNLTQARDRGQAAVNCMRPLNSMPFYAVQNAAWHALRVWVTQGRAPAIAPRMQRSRIGFVEDDDRGNALGGLRLPEIEVPVATYGSVMSNFTAGSWAYVPMFACVAGGHTRPFDAELLSRLYPNRQAYLQRHQAAADAALAAGFLRPADHAASLQRARATPLP